MLLYFKLKQFMLTADGTTGGDDVSAIKLELAQLKAKAIADAERDAENKRQLKAYETLTAQMHLAMKPAKQTPEPDDETDDENPFAGKSFDDITNMLADELAEHMERKPTIKVKSKPTK